MTSKLPRTRIIPISDFFTRLQVEYLCYKFRAMIYQRPFDKKKFMDICEQKKQKILQIALENCLPSIFNNEEQRRKYLNKFFNQSGCPNFCYRDEYQQRVKGYWDIVYYFVIGSSVRVNVKGSIELGRILSCNIKGRTLMIKMEDGKQKEVQFENATRIFPSDFYDKLFE